MLLFYKNLTYCVSKVYGLYIVSGIIPITAQKFLVSTQQAHVFTVDTQSDDLVCTDITSHLPQTHVQYLGLAHSPNYVMFVNVTSPSMVFDHLVVREPSTIHIFALKGAAWDPLTIINNSANLTNIWDCMEILRVKAAKAEDPSTVLRLTKQPESLSLYDLQVSMWMTVMINVCKVKKAIPNIDHIRQSKISRELPLIFVHSICAYLDNLVKEDTSLITDDQKVAINLLRRYLKMYLANEVHDGTDERDEKARQCAWKTLNAIASYPTIVEKCNLCCEKIDDLLWNVTSCPSGHKLPRCALTLLQITTLEYRVCRICGQMFHSCLEQVNQKPFCHFCNVPLLQNEYALDTEESELYGRNLSQLRVDVESSEGSDLEKSHKKKDKDKWNVCSTSDTCEDNSDEIILKNGNDKPDTIRETWEEL